MLDAATIQYKKHENFKEFKICCTCKKEKHYTEFYIHGRPTKAGYRLDYECKICKKLKSRANKWKNKFGISEQEVFQMYENQGKLCAICGLHLTLPEFGKCTKKATVLHIDHDHVTGKVRGLLCHGCNAGLGQFKDNKENLLSAYEYLNGT